MLVVLLGLLLASPPSPPLTLKDALSTALAHAPRLAALGLSVEERRQERLGLEGRLDLQLQVQLDLSRQRSRGRSLTGVETFDTTRTTLDTTLIQPLAFGTSIELGISASRTATDNPFLNCVPGLNSDACVETRLELAITQPLLRGGGPSLFDQPVQIALAAEDAALAEHRAQAQALALQVATDYVELALAGAAVEVERRAAELARAQLEAERARVALGQRAPADLPAFAESTAQREASLMAATLEQSQRQIALSKALGGPAPLPSTLPQPFPLALTPDDALTAALAESPELKRLTAQQKDAAARLALAEDQAKPALTLTVMGAKTGLDTTAADALAALPSGESHAYGARLSLALPVQNRAALADLAQASLALRRLEQERAAALDALKAEVAGAFTTADHADALIALRQTVVSATKASVEAEQQKLALGRSTPIDLITAQQAVAQAELALARAQADQLVAQARLLTLTGTLLSALGLSLSAP